MKEWVFSEIDKQIANNLAVECGIDSFTAYLLCSKGICDPFLVDEFLSDEVFLQDPYCFSDMDKGVERILLAIENGEKIAVFGDYDCDGVTSTTLLYSVLSELGADCMWRVPSRDEGYGMSETAVKELNQKGVKLIITVDNGISAYEEIDLANSFGIDVVVTDHHLPGETLPNAVAVIDPKREDCPSEFKDYAGVGVAFMLCCALCGESPEELLSVFGDLVCVGTIADVMPLTGDNRAIVKTGLNCIKAAKRVGLNALIEASGLTLEKINSSNIAFAISPRINATGRVFHPEKAIELLLCEESEKAKELANELCEFNLQRRELEADILAQALEQLESDAKSISAPVIVVGGENWHHGV
ncbi:MAG: DHH family phosphoesterase, partial [Clostridia bacterium]|nr:DHH family phosphoesterase [Clostridia bacterium]